MTEQEKQAVREEMEQQTAQARAVGREAVRQIPGMSEQDLEWIERNGDELLRLWRVQDRLEPGIHFDAIPAIWVYTNAVVQEAHRIGRRQPTLDAWLSEFRNGRSEDETPPHT